MQIIPAIDLMNGKVVRLTRGDPETMKTYEHLGDPVMVAKKWEKEGADAIHIVDLDAALNRGSNLGVIKEIVRAVEVPTQVGGGIRNLEVARRLLRMEVHRIIVGALAFNAPSVAAKLLMDFGSERVVVALDYRDDEVMVKGWKTAAKLSVEEAVTRFLDLGAKLFLVTSITRDGTLKGPDYEMLARVCSYPRISVIAAGGVGSLKDLAVLKQVGVRGVVIGKALYEGVFELREALKIGRGR
jgi:phosphoribosylformimino-5-aminoimidazole carboxamide ribotide isomerase